MSNRDFIRRILQHFINEERLTQKLAESYPIRRAAQLTAYFMQRGNEKVEELKESETMDRLRESAREKMNVADRKKDESKRRVNGFLHRFLTELDKEWQQEKKNLQSGAETKDKEKKID